MKRKKTALTFLLILFLCMSIYPQKDADKLNLMPLPVKVELTQGRFYLDTAFTVAVQGKPAIRLYHAASRMLRRLSGRTGIFFHQDYIVPELKVDNPLMIINIKRPGKVKLYEDESYNLSVSDNKIELNAETDIGALRGIETFLQLLNADSSGYYFPCVKIQDYPRFPWRGLMIDVCRHFMPVNVIKRNIDGMAAVKLNVLHLHLSDDQGFRIECKTFPKLTGMGSDGKFFTQAQIRDIIKYANDRGIRVVPEFDLPGHSTSWFAGYPRYASAPGPYTIERKWGIFDPTFDPSNPKTYAFLDKFFKEMCSLFPDEYMHIGGDENNGKQWNANPKIQTFMRANKIPNDYALQAYFNKKLLGILAKYHKKMVGWEEILQPGMPKNIVIQSWRGARSLEQSASEGYQVILSKGYYIDLCRSAEKHYLVDPVPDSLHLTDQQKKLIIGGEATMWSEFVSPETIDSRIWPRTAAIAERFWSPKNVKNVKDMYRRLDVISLELEDLGLTQIKNREAMFRRLANSYNTKALSVFISVVEPVQNYNRNKQRPDYTSYAPLTRVVDAAVPDPETARNFNYSVDDFLSGKLDDGQSANQIKQKLILWRDNDTQLEETIKKSPILDEIAPLSKELSDISSIGLQALNYLMNNKSADFDWMKKSLIQLKNADKPMGQVKLKVVLPIKKLVEQAGKI